MIRVILAPKEHLTPFGLRGQNFRVNVEFSTYYRGLKKFSKKWPKVTFRLEKKISRFLWNRPFCTTDDRKNLKKNCSYRRGPIGNFFQFFFRFLWPRYSSSTSRMTKYLLLTIDNEISRERSSWGKISKRRTETEAGRRRIKSVPRALVINRGRRENGRPWGKWTVQLGESGWSKAPKVDGFGLKWTVKNDKKGRSTKNETERP